MHTHLPGASLVPGSYDPSVLLTTAGMQQFKPYFFGYEQPPYKRAVTCQKCFRTSDLDNVGKTPRHQTFFEMLGNFSFGDYYKKEAISFAWEFITAELKINPHRLFVSVFNTDDEAAEIWNDTIGLPCEKIIRKGEEDNFWASGETGPCGPCSEIYYDLGENFGCKKSTCSYNCDCSRYLEIWNLVFMEFNRTEHGVLEPLPSKNIDTGMGLERITSVIQNVKTNFETDFFMPIIKRIEELAEKAYGTDEQLDTAIRIIADHIKSSAFLISDGVMPGNEGRGYVLRRVMRRAIRYGRLIGINKPFLKNLVSTIININQYYPELTAKQDFIRQTMEAEEHRFSNTLERGIKRLEDIIGEIINKGEYVISGEKAFELYDTYGFPFELTIEIAKEQGLSVNEAGYEEEMKKQVQRARAAGMFNAALKDIPIQSIEQSFPSTIFTGYDEIETKANILGAIKIPDKDNEIYLIFNKTPFYAESGGQVGDTGIIKVNDEVIFNVTNVQKLGDVFVHIINIPTPSMASALQNGTEVIALVDKERRDEIKRHHTATHLLQASLRRVLGTHIEQAGSLVCDSYARFDFTHLKAMDKNEISQVEALINERILNNISLCTRVMTLNQAKESGATALFNEKYGETVRVIDIEGFSKELCGGTHVLNTGETGSCRIISEEAIAAGMRRITLLAGNAAYKWSKARETLVENLAGNLKVPVNDLPVKIEKLQNLCAESEKEIGKLRSIIALSQSDNLLESVKESNGIKYIASVVDVQNTASLSKLAEHLLKKLGTGVVLIGFKDGKKANIILIISNDLVAKGLNANNLIKTILTECNGRGGGKPHFAMGGGDADKLEAALDLLQKLIS